MKRKGLLSLLVILAALVVALLSAPLPTNYAAQEVVSTNESAILTCPTGSLLAFPKPALNTTSTRVYIQQQDSFDRQTWEVESQQVGLPAKPSDGNTKVEIGFVVPPLDRGRYLAWHGSTNREQAADSLTFDAVPQLLADQGIVRGRPVSEVEVRVRIAATKRLRVGNPVPESVSVPVTLRTQEAPFVEVVSEPTVRTDQNGVARWRVRIKNLGIGELVASTDADQFEPTVMMVVGMAGDGESFFLALQKRNRELESVAATVADSMPRITASAPPRTTRVEEKAKSNREAEGERTGATWEAVAALEPRRIGEYELQPGDVLLVLGSSIISDRIRIFEQGQLGGSAHYSHASLYLGQFNGVRMVGEMWGSGFWITPLKVSVAGARFVDVYRFTQADPARRAELARNAANAFGDASRFIRSDSPSFITRGSVLPYAFEQIVLLGLASRGSLGSVIRLTIQNVVDPSAGGKRKMICSEYVAWAYHDAGLELQVPAWRALSDLNVLTSHERQHDYTTPNMLALSQSLAIVGRYHGP
jgi:hypothetical protein